MKKDFEACLEAKVRSYTCTCLQVELLTLSPPMLFTSVEALALVSSMRGYLASSTGPQVSSSSRVEHQCRPFTAQTPQCGGGARAGLLLTDTSHKMLCKRSSLCFSPQQGFKGFQVAPEHHNATVPFQFNGKEYALSHGSVVIAAITSCTNTSNPSVMLGAGGCSAVF